MLCFKYNKPELLAPAGSLSAGITGIDYGADAIYAGLKKFNARERTENFTFEEMSKLIAYAHKHQKKVYVTFNTLIKESEVIEVAEQLFEVSKLAPDAIIIQDLGLLYLIKNYFPWLNIHASTQMGIHNSAGANLAEKLGINRVILERQITINELETIRKNTSLELEVFIHGALCCSMSGNCLFSSWIGGYSGNRGECKQPCRKLYQSRDSSGYCFSTKDLCSLDLISTFKSLGITSLKIEGRLKKADYVRNVVSAYRVLIDSNDDLDIHKARKMLLNTPGRKFIAGFTTHKAFKNVIDPDHIGISGNEIGKVIDVKNGAVKVFLTSSLHIGDRVRIQPPTGEEGPALTVTNIFLNGRLAKKCYKGSLCCIKTQKIIPKCGIIYKIGESGGDLISVINSLPIQKHKVDLDIKVTHNAIRVCSPSLNLAEWHTTETFAVAFKRPITELQIAKEFSSTNSKLYETGKISVAIDGNLFIPSSILKEKRRNFWNYFLSNVDETMFFKESINAIEKFKTDYNSYCNAKRPSKNFIPSLKSENSISRLNHCEDIRKSVLLPRSYNNPFPDTVIVHTIDDFNDNTQEIILPEYCFEINIKSVEGKIGIAIKKGIKNFRITSLYGFELLRRYNGINITTSYPLPVSNSLATKEIDHIVSTSNLRLKNIQTWIELSKSEILNLRRKTDLLLELYYYGKPHLLVSRFSIPFTSTIKDPKNEEFLLTKDLKDDLYLLYSEKVFKSCYIENMSLFFDLSNAKIDKNFIEQFTRSLLGLNGYRGNKANSL